MATSLITPKKLTGAELELAAGRMRHPALAALEAEWQAAEGVSGVTPEEAALVVDSAASGPVRQQKLFS